MISLLAQSASPTPDLIAQFGIAGVVLLAATAGFRIMFKYFTDQLAVKDKTIDAKDAAIATLQAQAVERSDRTAPLLADALRILDEHTHATPIRRTRT